MRPFFRRITRIAAYSAVFLLGCSSSDKTYYEIEHAGVVLGYMEIWSTPGDPLEEKMDS